VPSNAESFILHKWWITDDGVLKVADPMTLLSNGPFTPVVGVQRVSVRSLKKTEKEELKRLDPDLQEIVMDIHLPSGQHMYLQARNAHLCPTEKLHQEFVKKHKSGNGFISFSQTIQSQCLFCYDFFCGFFYVIDSP
jgi:hypothetical protein